MRAEIAAIERLLKSDKTCVRRNATWDRIHDETGAGTVVAREIRFSQGDRQRLREYVLSQTGLDPQFDSRDGGRMALARHDASEKLGSDSVFGQLVVVATAGAARIAVQGREVRTPPGAVLSILPDRLDRERLKASRMVVVENGAILPFWQDIRLPEPWKDAVLVYRGHRENLRTVASLIREQPAEYLGFFQDFDPAGLAMATAAGRGSVLIPADWARLRRDSGINQPDVHLRQLEQLKSLGREKQPGAASVIGHMAREQLAVMQEHMVARQMALTAFAVNELFSDCI